MSIPNCETLTSSVFAQQVDSFALSLVIEKIRSKLRDQSGMSLVLFDANKVLYEYHTGYSAIEDRLKVNKQTAFYIASSTKSMLATTVLKLVDNGQLDLDVPINQYIPDIHFNSWQLSERKITIRTLLTHNTGINSKALEIRTSMSGEYDSNTLINLFSDANGSFSKPAYSNLNYILLGLIIETVTGKSWQYQMNKLLFEPLEMERSFSTWSNHKSSNTAIPHTLDSAFKLYSVPGRHNVLQTNTLMASGGVISSARDLTKYVQLFLNCGTINEVPYIPQSFISEATSIQVEKESRAVHNYLGFGLGWEIAQHDSLKLVLHNGSSKGGARSYMGFSPALGVGLVILSNENIVTPYVHATIAHFIWEDLNNDPFANDKLKENLDRFEVKVQRRFDHRMEGRQSRIFHMPTPDFNPILPLSNFRGKYFSKEFGTVSISTKQDELVIQFGNMNTSRVIRITEDEFVGDFGLEAQHIKFYVDSDQVNAVKFIEMGMSFNKVM